MKEPTPTQTRAPDRLRDVYINKDDLKIFELTEHHLKVVVVCPRKEGMRWPLRAVTEDHRQWEWFTNERLPPNLEFAAFGMGVYVPLVEGSAYSTANRVLNMTGSSYYSSRGARLFTEYMFEQENGKNWELMADTRREMRAAMYNGGQPLKCVQCGLECGPQGEAPACGH